MNCSPVPRRRTKILSSVSLPSVLAVPGSPSHRRSLFSDQGRQNEVKASRRRSVFLWEKLTKSTGERYHGDDRGVRRRGELERRGWTSGEERQAERQVSMSPEDERMEWTSVLLHQLPVPSPWRPFPNNHPSRGGVSKTHTLHPESSVKPLCSPALLTSSSRPRSRFTDAAPVCSAGTFFVATRASPFKKNSNQTSFSSILGSSRVLVIFAED